MALVEGDRADAISHLRRGLDVFPESPKLNLKLGQLLADLIIDSKNKLEESDINTAIGRLKRVTNNNLKLSFLRYLVDFGSPIRAVNSQVQQAWKTNKIWMAKVPTVSYGLLGHMKNSIKQRFLARLSPNLIMLNVQSFFYQYFVISLFLACLKMACEWDSFGSLVLGGILQQSNSDQAVTHYREFYRENPASPVLWNNLGPEWKFYHETHIYHTVMLSTVCTKLYSNLYVK